MRLEVIERFGAIRRKCEIEGGIHFTYCRQTRICTGGIGEAEQLIDIQKVQVISVKSGFLYLQIGCNSHEMFGN